MKEEIKRKLRELGVRPSKDLGQNFLITPYVSAEIVDLAAPKEGEHLIEIGPGLGALTMDLAAFPNLTVIEIEEGFAAKVREDFPQVEVINEDVRFVDFSELGDDLVVFGNLPYSFSSEITFHLLEFYQNIDRAVLMFQKEFAERIAAGPGSKKYGTISVLRALRADAYLGSVVPGDCFFPEAKVESQLIELRFLKQPRYEIKDDFLFKQLLHTVFKERRKKLSNTLKRIPGVACADPAALLAEIGLNPNARPEDLSPEDFVKLANSFC